VIFLNARLGGSEAGAKEKYCKKQHWNGVKTVEIAVWDMWRVFFAADVFPHCPPFVVPF